MRFHFTLTVTNLCALKTWSSELDFEQFPKSSLFFHSTAEAVTAKKYSHYRNLFFLLQMTKGTEGKEREAEIISACRERKVSRLLHAELDREFNKGVFELNFTVKYLLTLTNFTVAFATLCQWRLLFFGVWMWFILCIKTSIMTLLQFYNCTII